MFPYRLPAEASERPEPLAANPRGRDEPVGESTARISNKAIAAAILGVMAVMALVALFFALQTETIRRAHDVNIGKPQLVTVPLLVKIASNLWIIGLAVLLLSIWRNRVRAAQFEAARSAHGFRWVAGIVAILVAVSVIISLLSGPLRKQSSQLPRELELPLVRVKSPAQMEALHYLPADSNVIAAVDVAELLRRPEGEDFLAGWRLGPIDFGSNAVETWAGLKREAIDHAVLALKFDELLIPRATLVIRTKQPYDAVDVLKTLHAARVLEPVGQDRYRYRLGQIDAGLWCPPEGRILIYALTAKDLNAASLEPKPGIEHFSQALRELLGERLTQPAPLWIAGHSDQWDKTVLYAWLMGQPRPEQQALSGLRSFGLWLMLDGPATLNVAAACSDPKAAQSLATFLEEQVRGRLHGVKLVHDKNWVSGQGQGTTEDFRRVFAPPAAQARQP